MLKAKYFLNVIGAAVLPVLLSACTAEVGGGIAITPGADEGSLTVTWTVEGTDDPGACYDTGATEMELVVYDEDGARVTNTHSACDDFAVTLTLPEGRYSADATLVDPNNESISTTLPMNRLDIVGGSDLSVDIDFPQSSIL